MALKKQVKACALRTRKKQKELELREDNVMNALTGVQTDGLVLDTTTTTSTRYKPTIKTSKKTIKQQTLGKFGMKTSQNTTLSVQDFLAKLFQSREKDWDSLIQEARFSMKSYGLQGITELSTFSLKMLKAYYLTMKGEHLPLSLPRLMNVGIMLNGKCLTANISESLKTENESSLSQLDEMLNL